MRNGLKYEDTVTSGGYHLTVKNYKNFLSTLTGVLFDFFISLCHKDKSVSFACFFIEEESKSNLNNCTLLLSRACFQGCGHLGCCLLTSYFPSGRRACAHWYLKREGITYL
jgi:hypothetical protein